MDKMARQRQIEQDSVRDGCLRWCQNTEYQQATDTMPYRNLLRFQANVATLPVMTLSPISELVDLQKANRAPTSFAEIILATKEPQTVVDSMCRIVRCVGSPAASPK
jgi:hypothetical protein